MSFYEKLENLEKKEHSVSTLGLVGYTALAATAGMGLGAWLMHRHDEEERRHHQHEEKATVINDTSRTWTYKKGGIRYFRFVVYNLIPNEIPSDTLISMVNAQCKNSLVNYAAYYQCAADITIAPAAAASNLSGPENAKYVNGQYIPMFIGDFPFGGFIGFHSVNVTAAQSQNSSIATGGDIQSMLGFACPLPEMPYGAVSWHVVNSRMAQLQAAHNPYAFTDPMQFLCFTISHEINEILYNEGCTKLAQFDNTIPGVANWKYAQMSSDNQTVVNAVGTPNADGTINLPPLSDRFPYGFLASTLAENGDAVSWSQAGTWDAYTVDQNGVKIADGSITGGWAMSNFPLPSFWDPFAVPSDGKYDFLGHCSNALDPSGGLHEVVFITDFADGTTWVAEVCNFGPNVATQGGSTGLPYRVNVPPHTTFLQFFAPNSQLNATYLHNLKNGSFEANPGISPMRLLRSAAFRMGAAARKE